MAEEREPPPMQNEPDLFGNDDDDDDIFKSAVAQPTMNLAEDKPSESSATFDAEPMEESQPSKAQASPPETEVSLQDDDPVTPKQAAVIPEPADPDDGEDLFSSPTSDFPVKHEKTPATIPDSDSPNPSPKSGASKTKEEEDEEKDSFNIEVSVTNPIKIGDGMNAYMVYQVNTVTNIPAFNKAQFAVKRRFSDFLGLHDKLVAKHQPNGVIVPKAPEKSTMGMAKVKMSKEESGSQDFIEKRRAALERYMNRTVAHPTLRMDPDLRDYLTLDADLPKASGTSALSAAGVMRLFGRVGDAVTKLSSSITETDQWFEDKIQQIENLEIQLRKLHESSETLVMRRHTSSQNATQLARALAVVASCDEHTNLAQVMSKLAEVEDQVQQITEEQADSDFFTFSELLKDYLSQISAVKDVFAERIKTHKVWKEAEVMLNKKRETHAKLGLANKTDKIAQAKAECEEWEGKVKKGEEDFEKISAALKKEMAGFDKKRCKDFKANLINYLEKLMNNEEQLIKHWEAFLPEAKAIT